MIKQTFIRRVCTSVVQRVRTYVVQRKQTLKRTGVGLAVLGLLIFGASATFILTQESAPYTSELAFTERSENSDVMGTVIPASCESDIPQNHFVGDCQCSITASACKAYAPGSCLKTLSASANFYDIFWTSLYSAYGGWLVSYTLGYAHPLTTSYPSVFGSFDAWVPTSGIDLYFLRGADNAIVCSATAYGEAPPVPSAPTWMSATCPAQGGWGSIYWGGAAGYVEYYALRVDNVSTGGWDGSCTGGGDFCTNVGGTSFGFATSPTNTYGTWVHACNSSGCSAGVATSFNCPVEPIGHFDGMNCSSGWGWSCDMDNYAAPLSIHFYDGSTFIGSTPVANQTRVDVGPSCGGYTAHGFTFTTPLSVKTGTAKNVTAYAINIGSGSNNPSLGTIGLTCAVPVCTGARPANTTVYPGDEGGFLSDTPHVYNAANTAAKCEYACNSGYVWSGTSCDSVDIYATNASPVSSFVQEIGNPITFSGNAVNTNSTSVSQGGWAGVEVDWGSDGSFSYYDANGGSQLGAFTSNQSKALSYTENSAPAGIHQYRFNVDSSNVLAESSETNNRSLPTSFRIIGGSITISNVPAHGPGTITLKWSTQGTIPASNCAVKEGSNTWSGMSGNQPVPFTNHGTYTYILTCDGMELDRESVTIDLSPDLSVDKRMVEQSTNVKLTWKLYTQVGCTLVGGGLNQTVSVDDSLTTIVDGRTTYTLTCPIGSDSVMVEVVPKGWES